ncbi:hypothetical protein S245_034578 [Arachis hypogaea]
MVPPKLHFSLKHRVHHRRHEPSQPFHFRRPLLLVSLSSPTNAPQYTTSNKSTMHPPRPLRRQPPPLLPPSPPSPTSPSLLESFPPIPTQHLHVEHPHPRPRL